MKAILDAVSQFGNIYAIIGGLHGFSQLELFNKMQVICPTHCTQRIPEIKDRYARQYVPGGAGTMIEF